MASPSPDKAVSAKPRVRAPSGDFNRVRKLMRDKSLCTVCEEAACPNIGECWASGTATFLIMGPHCTRNCRFCNISHEPPAVLSPDEPGHVAESIEQMGLSHAVITSVTRDDLPDGGAGQFAACIREIHKKTPEVTVEVLVPDFRHCAEVGLDTVLPAGPDVFNHNVETVPRLYPRVRSGADYAHSLALLKAAKHRRPEVVTKSGLMVGLGETDSEVYAVLDDLVAHKVDFVTIGQYLRPSKDHVEVDRYVSAETFADYTRAAEEKGFGMVAASPLTRSSYNAGAAFEQIQRNR